MNHGEVPYQRIRIDGFVRGGDLGRWNGLRRGPRIPRYAQRDGEYPYRFADFVLIASSASCSGLRKVAQ